MRTDGDVRCLQAKVKSALCQYLILDRGCRLGENEFLSFKSLSP